ncbi:MAG: hypothetical protein ACFFCQ_05185 [Promethearchaeota archaeon]
MPSTRQILSFISSVIILGVSSGIISSMASTDGDVLPIALLFFFVSWFVLGFIGGLIAKHEFFAVITLLRNVGLIFSGFVLFIGVLLLLALQENGEESNSSLEGFGILIVFILGFILLLGGALLATIIFIAAYVGRLGTNASLRYVTDKDDSARKSQFCHYCGFRLKFGSVLCSNCGKAQ